MSQREKAIRPLEYCLERTRLALEDQLIPELRQEIIHQELSPDKVWREARRRLQGLRATADFSLEDKALATSYWWLAKTKRDWPEEFEKRIKQEEEEMGKRKLEETELVLPERTTIVLDDPEADGHVIRFINEQLMVSFCADLLSKIFNVEKPSVEGRAATGYGYPWLYLRNYFIQILEEKLGLKVKLCGHCKYYINDVPAFCELKPDEGRSAIKIRLYGGQYSFDTCERWTPKEVLKK